MDFLVELFFSDLASKVVMLGDMPCFPVSDLAEIAVQFCYQAFRMMSLVSLVANLSMYLMIQAVCRFVDKLPINKNGGKNNG